MKGLPDLDPGLRLVISTSGRYSGLPDGGLLIHSEIPRGRGSCTVPGPLEPGTAPAPAGSFRDRSRLPSRRRPGQDLVREEVEPLELLIPHLPVRQSWLGNI